MPNKTPEVSFEGPTQELEKAPPLPPVQPAATVKATPPPTTPPLAPTEPTVAAAPAAPADPLGGESEAERLLAAVDRGGGKGPKGPVGPVPKITLDTPVDSVISLDHTGQLLVFEDSIEGFKDLDEAVVQTLSRENQTRYLLAVGTNARLQRQRDNPELVRNPDVAVIGQHSPATARMRVEGGKPGMHYFQPLPSEVEQFKRLGYKVTDDPDIKTFGGDVGTVRGVKNESGQLEHVLMEIPEHIHIARLKEIGTKSTKRAKGIEEATRQDIINSGGLPLTGSEGRGGNWSKIGPEGAQE